MITFLFNINLVQNLIKNNLDFMLPKIIKLSATNNQTLCSFTRSYQGEAFKRVRARGGRGLGLTINCHNYWQIICFPSTLQ